MKNENLFAVGDERVSFRWDRADQPWAVYCFAHGAGAGMDHVFMSAASASMQKLGISVLRFNFPYWQQGKRRPDHRTKLQQTIAAALDIASQEKLPLFAGGKSMGGRMTSQLLAAEPRDHVRGLVYFGFPLHPAKKPGVERADHLKGVAQPMLFLQGDRDALSEWDLIAQVTSGLPQATLHKLDGADHSFHVLKRSGRTDPEVLDEMTQQMASWCRALVCES